MMERFQPDLMSPLLSVTRRRVAAIACVIGLQLVIALPFLVISPSSVRGVPGPLLIVISLAASFLLGARVGVALTAFGVFLAVTIIDENAVAAPLVWIPTALLLGLLGDSVRHGEELRRSLVTELRSGLVALSHDPRVGPLQVISRYLPAEREQILAGDFYGVVVQPDGDVALMVGDVPRHGPDAAAVATHLRAAWRGLAVAGVPADDIMRVLNDSLMAESRAGGVRFATVCLGSVEPTARRRRWCWPGTRRRCWSPPPPPRASRSPGPGARHRCRVQLAATAGRASGRRMVAAAVHRWPHRGGQQPNGPRPFGEDRLSTLLDTIDPPLGERDVDGLLTAVRSANGGPMLDDIVVLAVSPARGPAPEPEPIG